MQLVGILLSLVAMVGWGFDDFYIQQVSRRLGTIKTLFFIGITGAIGLLPLVWVDLLTLREDPRHLLLLFVTACIATVASVCNFEALKRGKISIIEPITGLELPLVVGLGIVVLHEAVQPLQLVAMALVFAGIVMAVTTHRLQLHYDWRWFERGGLYALAGAMGMGLTVFMVGLASQATSALLVVWINHTALAATSILWLAGTGQGRSLRRNWRKFRGPLMRIMVLDNVAWICFGMAARHLPISLATTLSESYIIVAVLLGVFVAKERLRRHQALGVLSALAGILLLTALLQDAG